MKKGYLILENGRVFEGKLFGAERSFSGELVFTTSMCGYVETVTDPAFSGQIVLNTFPVVGAYGANEEDAESAVSCGGFVVREICEKPSNFRMEKTFSEFLKKRGVVGICGVDTREIASIIRKEGSMTAAISSEKDFPLTADKVEYEGERAEYTAEDQRFKASLIDFGVKKSLIKELLSRGVSVEVFPKSVSASEILESGSDFVVLSSGPEGGFDYQNEMKTAAEIFGKKPIFAVGLGHLILSGANGADIVKLKSGHRGGNYPVIEADSQKAYITNQNHSFVAEKLKKGKAALNNLNDNTVEAVVYEEEKTLSVAFYPETSEDPQNTGFIYDRFLKMLGGDR